ncbi:DUF4142 domain-containing protein [Novosphingobium profundi]|uniref:DUF4142 domain-containing protein n=1 Tax=Novosphingobium profundi TaxID=1774954 RepID=UPI001BDB1D34|nr:DUF4142 domain-containing protein [Novosphingobium profundi]MBT0670607.1 DUF4142 domain-containing protein [Novosphingobium profundi]
MKPRIEWLLCSLALVSACNDRGEQPGTRGTPDAGASLAVSPTAHPELTTNSAMNAATLRFVDTVAAANRYEIAAAHKAKIHAGTKAIRDLADTIIKDHEKAQDDLENTLKDASLRVGVSRHLSDDQQAKLDALDKAGTNFDRTYLEQQIAAHQGALALLRDYAGSGDNAALAGFAKRTAPTVENHLDVARHLAEAKP